MLDADRFDGLAGYDVNFDNALSQRGSTEVYKKLPAFVFSTEYLAGAKGNPDIIAILDAFDAGKRNLIKNGVFAEIEKKWGN